MTLDPTVIASAAALGAALCWAAGGLVAVGAVRRVGAVTFNRTRMVMAAAMLALAVGAMGGWRTLTADAAVWLALSAVVGIVLGDTALFLGLGRLGPRRNSVVYATNAPMAAVLGWMLLGEELSAATSAGIVLVTAGVMLAVFHRPGDGAAHDWETVRGRLGVGVAVGLAAALCQAAGAILAKPAMAAGVDPVAASAVRVGVAAAVLAGAGLVVRRGGEPLLPTDARVLAACALSGLLGLGIGMTLLLVGLAYGKVGVVATLSATSPVLMLPLLWVAMRRAPAPGGWIGAALAVAGVALIVNR